jgi:peptidoglycan/LPS O-acetylase OafA/YrhL
MGNTMGGLAVQASGLTALDSLYERLQRRQIPALDGVRMIAVFLVILYHFGFTAVPGAHGVMLFFVLSGFLITWLLLEEQATTGTVSLTAFYWRRTLRIFPAFYAFWLFVVVVGLLRSGDPPSAHAWSAFFYVSNYYSALNAHPVNAFSHTWSLGIEEQFYLIWPFVFLQCRGNLRLLTKVLGAVIVVVAIHRIALLYVVGVDQSYVYSAFDTRVDQLMVGALTAVLLKRRVLQKFWASACGHPFAPVVTIALLAASITVGATSGGHYRYAVGFVVEPFLYAILLIQLVGLSHTAMWSWLDSPPAAFLGRISYPLYLYQQITLYPVRRVLSQTPVPLQLLAAVLVTVLVATISYVVIERPFLRLKRRQSPLHATSTATATS